MNATTTDTRSGSTVAQTGAEIGTERAESPNLGLTNPTGGTPAQPDPQTVIAADGSGKRWDRDGEVMGYPLWRSDAIRYPVAAVTPDLGIIVLAGRDCPLDAIEAHVRMTQATLTPTTATQAGGAL